MNDYMKYAKKPKYNVKLVREELTKQKDRGVWNVAELLRLCSIPNGNFYLFLKGKRGLTDENIAKLLNIFQLSEKKFKTYQRK